MKPTKETFLPTKTYPFEEGGADRVELSWGRKFKDFTVTVDGQRLNPEPYGLSDLQAGQKLPLNDGSSLHVGFEKRVGLKVTRDWKPLPGSPTHPRSKAKAASNILFAIAGFTAIFVAIAIGTGLGTDIDAWFGVGSVLVYLGLGIAVRRGSLVALWVGIILFSLDTVLFLFTGDVEIGWLVVRGALIYGLFKALPAMKQLREAEAAV